jgi:hypothetical protein
MKVEHGNLVENSANNITNNNTIRIGFIIHMYACTCPFSIILFPVQVPIPRDAVLWNLCHFFWKNKRLPLTLVMTNDDERIREVKKYMGNVDVDCSCS